MSQAIFDCKTDPVPVMVQSCRDLEAIASGLVPGGAPYDALAVTEARLCRQMLSTRARTLAGVLARMRYLQEMLESADDSPFLLSLVEAAIEDIEALEEQGPPELRSAAPSLASDLAAPGKS
jgi:hypothetical protein